MRRKAPPVDVRIDRLLPGSFGAGEVEGQTYAVRGAPPGSVVHAAPFHREDGVWQSRRLALVEPPPDAVTPRCALFGLCGGCALQELSLEAQRQAKLEMVRRIVGPVPTDHGVFGAPQAYGYRNKAELAFGPLRYRRAEEHALGPEEPGRYLGFHAAGNFAKVVDCARCELLPEGLNAVIEAARAWLARSPRPVWDTKRHTGFWKHLVVRESSIGERLVALYTAEDPSAEEELRAFAQTLPGVRGVCWFVNPRVADAAIGELRLVLRGEPFIEERLGERRYRLSPTSFFQTNTAGARVLYDRIGEAAGRGPRLFDLYCGAGSIGLYLADRFEQVLGIELNAAAVEDARVNAELSGLAHRVRFVAGTVEANLPELGAGDVVVVDPPRNGLHPKASAWLAEQAAETLVYVACWPASLARDRIILEAGGWRLTDLWTVDLFPQTGHVEAVARFTRGR